MVIIGSCTWVIISLPSLMSETIKLLQTYPRKVAAT